MTDTTTAVPFCFDFKSVAPVQLEDGQLLIRGESLNGEWDREGEAWAVESPALLEGIRKFLKGNAPLCFAHDFKTVLGTVVSATPIPGRGIEIEAVVDYQPPGSPWRHLYESLRRGRLSNLSWGGLFRKVNTPEGPRIVDADFLELSVCSASVGKGTTFEIVAGKALSAPDGKAVVNADVVDLLDERIQNLKATLNYLATKDNKMPFTDWPQPMSEAEYRKAQQARIAATAREEAHIVDGVSHPGETVEVRWSGLLGGRPRDALGQPIDTPFDVDELRPAGDVPDTVSADDLYRALTGRERPQPRELTPEERFALDAQQAARRAADEAKDSALKAKLNALKARVAAQEDDR